MVSLLLVKQAGDCRQPPVLIGLMEFCCMDSLIVERAAQLFEMVLVSNRQVDVGWMVIARTTVLIGMFNCGMTGLNCLLRDGDIAARYRIKVSLGRADLHDSLTS